MYVIQRTDRDGGFVTRPEAASAYTFDVRWVRVFKTHEEAKRERGTANEVIVPLAEVLGLE